MNQADKTKRLSPTASEYIDDNFKPSDRIAVLVLNRPLGETTQRITAAQKVASGEFRAWLRYKNANGADIYVGMNRLKQDASTRTKDDIETIRPTYLYGGQYPGGKSSATMLSLFQPPDSIRRAIRRETMLAISEPGS